MRAQASTEALSELRGVLAEALVRSKLDTSDEILALTALLGDLRAGELLSPLETARLWPAAGGSLKLDVSFPYCGQRCLYCLFGTKTASAATLAEAVDDLAAEAAFFGTAFKGRSFRELFVGRGTPTILPAERLEGALRPVLGAFALEAGALVSIECHPSTVDPAKLALLRRMGFNRISFGVESLDSRVLASVGRGGQGLEPARRAVAWARAAGFADVNLDLVFGLAGEQAAGFSAGFEQLTGLRPNTITVCALTLTDAYSRASGLKRARHQARLESLFGLARPDIQRAARRAGYSADELDLDRGLWVFVDRSAPVSIGGRYDAGPDSVGPSSILGLGRNARSHAFGSAFYRRGFSRFDAARRLYRVHRSSPREEMARYILSVLNQNLPVREADFRRWFDASAREMFALELAVLRAWGRLVEDGRGFSLKAAGSAQRMFYASVFLMESLRRSPFWAGSRDLESRLERGLQEASA